MLIFATKIDGRKSCLLVKERKKWIVFSFLSDNDRVWLRGCNHVMRVLKADGKSKWAIGDVHSVVPGRGDKAVCRVKILDMKLTTPAQYTSDDLVAEGFFDEMRRITAFENRCQYPRRDRFYYTLDALTEKPMTKNIVGVSIRFEVTKDPVHRL